VSQSDPPPDLPPPQSPPPSPPGAPRWLALGGRTLGIAALSIAPLILNGYWLFLLSQAAVQSVAILSAVVLFRVAGALSLCQASFIGVGAYLAAWLATGPGLPLWLSFIIAPLLAAPLGLILAFPALRLSSLELSILTITVALMLTALVFSSSSPFKVGDVGAQLPSNEIFGVSLTDARAGYVFTVLVAAMCFIGTAFVLRGPIGRVWQATASGQAAAAAGGIDVTRHKMLGFAFSAALAAVAGVLLIAIYSTVDVNSFSVLASVQIVLVAALFGMTLEAGITGGLVLGLAAQVPKEFGLQNEWITAALGFVLVGLVLQSRLEVTARV
jgi:branched-chain amino acid transport system permease protein